MKKLIKSLGSIPLDTQNDFPTSRKYIFLLPWQAWWHKTLFLFKIFVFCWLVLSIWSFFPQPIISHTLLTKISGTWSVLKKFYLTISFYSIYKILEKKKIKSIVLILHKAFETIKIRYFDNKNSPLWSNV